jgi:hypothetical protein
MLRWESQQLFAQDDLEAPDLCFPGSRNDRHEPPCPAHCLFLFFLFPFSLLFPLTHPLYWALSRMTCNKHHSISISSTCMAQLMQVRGAAGEQGKI